MEPVAPSGEGKEGVGQGAVFKGTWSHGSEGGNRIPPQLEFSSLNHNRCRSKFKVESIKVQQAVVLNSGVHTTINQRAAVKRPCLAVI